MANVGPVEYVVIAFPGNRFRGEIVPAVAELVDNNVVRSIDVAFIKMDADGNVTMFEYDVLDDVLAFGFADVDDEAEGVLNDEDLELGPRPIRSPSRGNWRLSRSREFSPGRNSPPKRPASLGTEQAVA